MKVRLLQYDAHNESLLGSSSYSPATGNLYYIWIFICQAMTARDRHVQDSHLISVLHRHWTARMELLCVTNRNWCLNGL